MENIYIKKKEHFKNCIEKVVVNNLKFILISSAVSHKYQRNLVQEIFGRVFRNEGSLSLVLKI
jgi:hypothetical protein